MVRAILARKRRTPLLPHSSFILARLNSRPLPLPRQTPSPTVSHDPFHWIPEALADLEREGLRRWRRVGAGQPRAGQLGGAFLNFGTNDYLALASDPRLVEAAGRAAETHGWGAGASPAVCGRTPVHEELEERLAQFEGTDAAILFPSGFAANAGVIPTLVGEGDTIYGDAKNHASLIDGCRLARAERFVYPHGDTGALARLLAEDSRDGRRLIVTDTLFSMDGDFAPLKEIAQLATEYDAMLLVDEAHATGVWGPKGRGIAENLTDLEEQSLIRVGTLSKSLGASGGFVVGSQSLIDWLANRARPYVFSTAPPAAMAAAAIAAIDIVQSEPERRERVRALGNRLRALLHADEWETGSSASQIVPILLGDPDMAVRLSDALLESGIYVPAIRPPSVPAGESLLRVSLSASHTEEDLDQLVRALRVARPA